MGLFSFLFGGKKKPKAEAPAKAPVKTVAPKPSAAPASIAPVDIAQPATGVVQARLRLRLAASLRTGERAAAYEAAKGLADIQVKAGRATAARIWRDQAERIRASL